MRRVGHVVLSAITLAATVLSYPMPTSAARDVQGSPKIMNLFLDWKLTDADVASLARWDVVVLDADQEARYPEQLRKLKQLNPSIKILAYLPSEEISDARFSEPADYPFAKLAAHVQDEWYVHDPSGAKTFFWQGSSLLNVTDRGPIGTTGERWNEFLPRFIHNEVLSSGLWDGVFLDNTFDGISYFAKTPVDLDRNGKAETSSDADAAWRDGMKKMLKLLRQYDPKAIIIGNGGAAYADQLDGAFFEHFPSYNWSQNEQQYRTSVAKNRKPTYTALNVNTDNANAPTNYKLMRYGLGSALLGSGYYSFDQGDQNHSTLWWYDEYEAPIGVPKSEPKALAGASSPGFVPAAWSRSYDHGLALVNSTDKSLHVSLPGVFEKLHGTQDAATNDGTVVNAVDIASHDGLVLLTRSDVTEVKNSAFENGSFIRIFDATTGKQAQNGFFAQRSGLPSGVQVIVADLDHDGQDDFITTDHGSITVRLGNAGRATTFRPFGSTYTGSMSIAVGKADASGVDRIIVGRLNAPPPDIKMFTPAGRELGHWLAYVPAFRGGVTTAVGDLNGDGLTEIVTGAGPGGGPHVRIWKTDGSVWGGSFFAFDQSERGGVNVATGDVDGDGKAEIVVGSGQGAIPRVRIFSGAGILKKEIVLGKQPVAGGIHVTASDINGDGKAEILVSGLPLF